MMPAPRSACRSRPLVNRQEAHMRIACTDGTAAAQVQLLLEGHGIVQDVFRTGPHENDPTVWIIASGPQIDSQADSIRQQIEEIAGATVED
jgi:hypothetical protein